MRTVCIVLALAACVCSAQSPKAKPEPARRLTAKEATAILEAPAKEVLPKALQQYLKQHGLQIFSTSRGGTSECLFRDGKHCFLGGGFGGIGLSHHLVDLNNDGRKDLLVSYQFGSGMVRPGTTIVLDTGKTLRVFQIHGAGRLVKGKWRVSYPLKFYGAGKDYPDAMLVAKDGAITAVWPEGEPPPNDWEVVKELSWQRNSRDYSVELVSVRATNKRRQSWIFGFKRLDNGKRMSFELWDNHSFTLAVMARDGALYKDYWQQAEAAFKKGQRDYSMPVAAGKRYQITTDRRGRSISEWRVIPVPGR